MDFRTQCWEAGGIESLNVSQTELAGGDLLRLCLRYISDMNTSLAIPILARYWCEYGQSDSDDTFLAAVKAVTAFITLRRSVTTGTQGIDSDFRRLMTNSPKSGGDPLCVGQNMSNAILDVDELRCEFRSFLGASTIGVHDKATWIGRAKDLPLASQSSRHLCRFLMLAAAHHA